MATNNSINNVSKPISSTAVTIDPGASGDSYVQFSINGTGEFRLGVDDTDSDAFVLSQGSALGTSNTMRISSAGERTLPLQSAFRAEPSADLTNVTGDGTVYTGVFATENFDRNSDFDGTSTFTAPISGVYYFSAIFRTVNLTTSFSSYLAEFNLNSGTLYPFNYMAPSSGVTVNNDRYAISGFILLSMAASDTLTLQLTVSGSTKTVDLISNATFFGGYLIG